MSKVFILVKVDFGHKTNIDVFDTQEKAKALQTSLELEAFDSGDLCGVSYYIEEFYLK